VISAFWILSANSWMQTPTGYEMRDGVAYPLDWVAIIFNPGFPHRFAHMVTAAYLTTAFVVLAVGARYLLAGRHLTESRVMMHMAIGLIAILAPLQLLIGDQHGLNTLKYQPVKVAAMEAHWDGSKPGDFELFAWPDEKAETNRLAISIPRGSSLILTHDPSGLFPGLTSVPPQERPPIVPVFFAFRIMVGIGLLMIAAGWLGLLLWLTGRLFEARWYLWLVARGWWIGFVAVICGWIVTETGRQPWIAFGILRTADAISPLSAASVAVSLVLFVIVYGIVFGYGIYYINRLIVRGPEGAAIEPPTRWMPGRALSAVEETGREILSGRPKRT
jgi:cytochrome d ubiquinol oxidase subunit I